MSQRILSLIPRCLKQTIINPCRKRHVLENISTSWSTTLCAKCQSSLSNVSCRRPKFAILPRLNAHTIQYATVAGDKDGMLSRMWQGLGFTGKLKYKKSLLYNSGLRLYLCCVELIDYKEFFEVLELPDTFNSWFRITELHMWMCIVRLALEDKEGRFVRNAMMRFMWNDMEKRTKKLGDNSSVSNRQQGIQLISQQFKSALFAYDEGLLDCDRVLASALWRNLFDMTCDDPEKVELMVKYVRKQIIHLDQQDCGVILTSGLLSFLPLTSEETDSQREKQIMANILKRI